MWWSRRAIGLHAALVVSVPGFFVLGWWQLHRALSGNELSWVYTFEWPFFAAYAVWMWWKLVHEVPAAPRLDRSDGDEGTPGLDAATPDAGGRAGAGSDASSMPVSAAAGPARDAGAALDFDPYDDSDPELAAYNRYLAGLHAADRTKRP